MIHIIPYPRIHSGRSKFNHQYKAKLAHTTSFHTINQRSNMNFIAASALLVSVLNLVGIYILLGNSSSSAPAVSHRHATPGVIQSSTSRRALEKVSYLKCSYICSVNRQTLDMSHTNSSFAATTLFFSETQSFFAKEAAATQSRGLRFYRRLLCGQHIPL